MLNAKGDIQRCNPVARASFMALRDRLHHHYHETRRTKTFFMPFETYRSPMESQRLYDEGRTSGRMVSKAQAWQSAHNYGLAVDFVPKMTIDGKVQWSWDDSWDWDFIAQLVNEEFKDELYLEAPEWDRGHVTHVAWLDWRTVMQVYRG